jgi:hypothetical protein
VSFELRWLERETDRILQYRTKIVYTDYGIMEHSSTHYGERTMWSEWTDVPVVSDRNNA